MEMEMFCTDYVNEKLLKRVHGVLQSVEEDKDYYDPNSKLCVYDTPNHATCISMIDIVPSYVCSLLRLDKLKDYGNC